MTVADPGTSTPGAPPCAVEGCGRTGTERHHFFPVAIFGRAFADRWPTAVLCPSHHQQWHWFLTPASFHRRLDAIRAKRSEREAKAAEAAAAEPTLWEPHAR